MSKAKLDKGDQQLEMVGNYVIAFFKGVAAGVKKTFKENDKMVLFIIVTLISGVIFYLRKQISSYIVPDAEFHVLKVVLLLAPILPVLLLNVLGHEEKGSSDDFEAKFARIKFCGKDGSYPIFKGKETKDKEVIYTFYSPGINVYEWKNRELELETVLDCDIDEIKTAENTKQVIILHTVPSGQGIKNNIPWDDAFIRKEDFEICIGNGLLNDAVINLNDNAHALIGGTTGSGKSVIVRSMTWQCIRKGAKLYLFDFKGGVEFGRKYEQFGEVVTERQEALEILKLLTKEMKMRLAIFRNNGVQKLCEYNQIAKDNPLCRIVVVCDEISEMLDKMGLPRKDQAIFDEIVKEMSSLARQGRAAGINMILATQRPDANIIPGQIKNNLTLRICGRMIDDHASKMVIGNTNACRLPDIKGRFLYTVGADTYEFQAFKFEDASLIYGDYQIGAMLIEHGHNGKNIPLDSELDEYDEEDQLLDYNPELEGEKFEELEGF